MLKMSVFSVFTWGLKAGNIRWRSLTREHLLIFDTDCVTKGFEQRTMRGRVGLGVESSVAEESRGKAKQFLKPRGLIFDLLRLKKKIYILGKIAITSVDF